MSNVENRETGSQLITSLTTRNNPPAKSGPKGQSEDSGTDFLTDVLSKALGLNKLGSAPGQENSGELKGIGQESLNLCSAESVIPLEALEKKDSPDPSLSFQPETVGLQDQVLEKGDEDLENKTVRPAAFPPLESFFISQEGFLKDNFIKTEVVNAALNNAILQGPGEGAVIQPDRGPIDGALTGGQGSGTGSPGLAEEKGKIKIERPKDRGILIQGAGPDSSLGQASILSESPAGGQGPGAGSPGLADPKGEIKVERPKDRGIFLQGPGPDSGLSQASIFSKDQDPVVKSGQSPVEGNPAAGQESGAGTPGLAEAKGEIKIERPKDRGIFLQGSGPDSGLSQASIFSKDQDPVIKSGPVEGTPGSVGTTEGNPVERPERQGSLDLKEGLKTRLDENFLLDKLKTFVEKISQSPAEEPVLNITGPEGEKAGFLKSIKPSSGEDTLQREGLAAEIRIQLPQDRPSSHSMMIEKTEGAPSEKGKEGEPGVSSLIKEGFIDDPQSFSLVKDRVGPETILDNKGLNNNDMTQTGENLPGDGSRQVPILPADLKDPIFREAIINEKSIKNNPEQLHHFPKTYESDFLRDHYFSVKKQTASSMEISLEPVGLGKLDIELNLNQDRLQGQIMVNDKAGKELIERNLPQLLLDLASDGLQIGGFTVSLKQQGRGQDPVPTRTEFEELPLRPVSPEKVIPILQGNHLIHIIV